MQHKRYKKHGLYSKVIDELKTDKIVENAVRKLALKITNAHLWVDQEKAASSDG